MIKKINNKDINADYNQIIDLAFEWKIIIIINMIILGIHDGHNASAALIINGELKCSVAEERLSRQKNHYGFPENAIKCVIEQAGIKFKDIDRVAMSTNKAFSGLFLYRKKLKIEYCRLLERTKRLLVSKNISK